MAGAGIKRASGATEKGGVEMSSGTKILATCVAVALAWQQIVIWEGRHREAQLSAAVAHLQARVDRQEKVGADLKSALGVQLRIAAMVDQAMQKPDAVEGP